MVIEFIHVPSCTLCIHAGLRPTVIGEALNWYVIYTFYSNKECTVGFAPASTKFLYPGHMQLEFAPTSIKL